VAARYESSLERLGKVVASALQEALQEESVVIVVRRDPAPKSRPNQ
jgi:GTP cyclohydrolase I